MKPGVPRIVSFAARDILPEPAYVVVAAWPPPLAALEKSREGWDSTVPVRSPAALGWTEYRIGRGPDKVCETLRVSSEIAGWTGLEPAASGVTGRRYNQLNYHPNVAVSLRFSLSRFLSLVDLDPHGVGGTGLEPATAGL